MSATIPTSRKAHPPIGVIIRTDEAVFDSAETIEGAKAFMGSKYTQSKMRDCYQKVKEFLTTGRLVLFTGTGCQVAGLKKYLKKGFSNALCDMKT